MLQIKESAQVTSFSSLAFQAVGEIYFFISYSRGMTRVIFTDLFTFVTTKGDIGNAKSLFPPSPQRKVKMSSSSMSSVPAEFRGLSLIVSFPLDVSCCAFDRYSEDR